MQFGTFVPAVILVVVSLLSSGCNLSDNRIKGTLGSTSPDDDPAPPEETLNAPTGRRVNIAGSVSWVEQGQTSGTGYHGKVSVHPLQGKKVSGGGYHITVGVISGGTQ